jgi:hypothetical protein
LLPPLILLFAFSQGLKPGIHSSREITVICSCFHCSQNLTVCLSSCFAVCRLVSIIWWVIICSAPLDCHLVLMHLVSLAASAATCARFFVSLWQWALHGFPQLGCCLFGDLITSRGR